MATFQLACVLLLAGISCGSALADERANRLPAPSTVEARKTAADLTTGAAPEGKIDKAKLPRISSLDTRQKRREEQRPGLSQEPFGLQTFDNAPSELSVKWADLSSRIRNDEETLAACDRGDGNCPPAARRLLSIIELGRERQSRARLGEINRAVNLSIRPVSDWSQYRVEDFWSTPIATLSSGAGDCEDYAIVKYVALRAAGITRDDLRLVIVRDGKRKTDHAVVAVRSEGQWLLLDNRTLVMIDAIEAHHYHPLFELDDRGVREFVNAGFAP